MHKKIQEMLDNADIKRKELYETQAIQIQAAVDASGMSVEEYVLKFEVREVWTSGYDTEKEAWWMQVEYRIGLKGDEPPEDEFPVDEEEQVDFGGFEDR